MHDLVQHLQWSVSGGFWRFVGSAMLIGSICGLGHAFIRGAVAAIAGRLKG